MEITRLIVNKNYSLAGFGVEGKSFEFGEVGRNKVQRTITLQEMARVSYNNGKIRVYIQDMRPVVQEIGSFKLKELPMEMFMGNGMYEPVDNTIELIQRVLLNGELIGFQLLINNQKKNVRKQDIMALYPFFKGKNFLVRYDVQNNKKYIAGKSGHSLQDLPSIETAMGDNVAVSKNKRAGTRSVTKSDGKDVHAVKDVSPFDMLTLGSALDELGGQFLLLPGTVYNNTLVKQTETPKEFRKTQVEISDPRPAVSETTPNIALNFKQIGQLEVNVRGTKKVLYPYAHKRKIVFEAGKLNTPHIGIAIHKDNVPALQNKFGASMSLSEIVDPMTNIYCKNFLTGMSENVNDIILLSLKTEYLSMMNIETAKKCWLSEKELIATVRNQIHTKILTSYCKGIIKDAEATMESAGQRPPKPLYGAYAGMSEEELADLEEAGIDVFTGAYVKVDEISEEAKAIDKKGGKTEVSPVEILYGIAGMKSLPTYKTIKSGAAFKSEANAVRYEKEIKHIAEIDSAVAKLDSSVKIYKFCEEMVKKLGQKKLEGADKIWKHNLAAVTLGGEGEYKVQNPSSWVEKKALKNGMSYEYAGSDAEGLAVNISGFKLV